MFQAVGEGYNTGLQSFVDKYVGWDSTAQQGRNLSVITMEFW